MLNEPKINKNRLAKKILTEYAIKIASFVFIPIGEASYGYKVTAEDGKKYFLKLIGDSRQAKRTREKLDLALELTDELKNIFGIKNISYPICTNKGELKTSVDEYVIVINPFIDGKNFAAIECSLEVHRKLTTLLAKIHKLESKVETSLPVENFELKFIKELTDSLDRLEQYLDNKDKLKKELAELLVPIKPMLYRHIEDLKRYQDLAKKIQKSTVLAHTDPIASNLMLDNHNEVYIIDWDGALKAPHEHDLMFFLGNRFELFMETYQKTYGKVTLKTDLFAYFIYKRYLDDLTDWILRILYENKTAEQSKADLRGIKEDCLEDYEGIENWIEKIDKQIAKYT